MKTALLEPPVVALEPELGSMETVHALALRPRAAVKAIDGKSFIGHPRQDP
ncbi:MAG: hypothetical protein WAT67_05330 [Candidatus Contendobacter sp.]